MTVTAEEKEQIKQKGFAYTGGLTKYKYWTPDGQEIFAVPNIRTFNRIKDGKVIGSGTRDANLENGWLDRKPEVLKPHCPNCNKWHDTQEEIDKCGEDRAKMQEMYNRKAEKEVNNPDIDTLKSDVLGLKSDVGEIKDMLMKLIRSK